MEKSQPKYGEYVYKYMFEHDEQGNTIYRGKERLHVKFRTDFAVWVMEDGHEAYFNRPKMIRDRMIQIDLEGIIQRSYPVSDDEERQSMSRSSCEEYSFECFSEKEILCMLQEINCRSQMEYLQGKRNAVKSEIKCIKEEMLACTRQLAKVERMCQTLKEEL